VPDRPDVKIKNHGFGAVWRRAPLFYITILATLCIKGLMWNVAVIDQHSHEVNTLRLYHERQVRCYRCHQMYKAANRSQQCTVY